MVQRIRVSREQLSEFLTDPRAIKQFEQLFTTVDATSTASEDTVITAALASTTANLALDTALRAANDDLAAPLLDTADLVRRYGPETVPGDKDFTGSSTSTTPAVDNNTTRIATTAFVLGQASGSLPVVNGVATIGTSYRYSRQDHIHPTDGTLVPSTRTISTTAPLTGGGDLSADRTFVMAAATDAVPGYLTAADHTSFAAKAETAITTAVASDTLTAGQWINFHNVAGVKNARPADMTDATKPAQGFVLAGFASAATATVYLAGVNTVIPVGAYAAADVGKPVFLSTAGGTTLTPPATTGNLLQQVGWVDAVGATVTVNFINSPGIVRA